MIKSSLFLSTALGAALLAAPYAFAADAAASASSTASASADNGNTVSTLIVTAEKREQSLQTVPVAISAYTAQERQKIGIDSIQDMTNFTPGLEYNTSTDRISLRGVGRQTNVLSADASVANYSDGVYETFAVGAGASTIFVDRVEVLRGPQGTLYGRNAIGGAINIISRQPTSKPYAEIRGTFANYDHYTIEGAVSGPITDRIEARLAGSFEKQARGWIHNVVPGVGDEGNRIATMYFEGQLKWKITDHLDFWTKIGFNQWNNRSGGPGAASGGWTPEPFDTSEFGNAATQLNPGYGCSGVPNHVVNASPLGCANPAINSPWQEARAVDYNVRLPYAFTIATHLTWHLPGADVRYITGGVNYHYILTGPSGGVTGQGYQAPITQYTLPSLVGVGGLTVFPQETFVYQEINAFWSHEINIVSTGNGPLQWLIGGYYYRQHYRQPVYTQDPQQAQWGDPSNVTCGFTPGCASNLDDRRFDNRPSVTNKSEAVFGQVDYKVTPTLKLTGGLRYSHDEKFGEESVRILCFGIPACYVPPELNAVLPGGLPSVDLTQVGTVVPTGRDASGNPLPLWHSGLNYDGSDPVTHLQVSLPRGVLGATTYTSDGFAHRLYDANWGAVTGTAGIEWTPDSGTLAYFKYSRGYKSGGFNIGIFTVESFQPYTDSEHVNSFELGLKKTINRNLTIDTAMFWYTYTNMQIPITSQLSAGGLTQSETTFYNVPKATTRGIEVEVNYSPVRNLNFYLSYSFLDAYVNKGCITDIADPDALQPGAKPVAGCAADGSPTNNAAQVVTGGPTADIYTGGTQVSQDISGNRLPNSAKNKIALNSTYTWNFEKGDLTASFSFIWRDAQYGSLFTRPYNRAPSWDQLDARLTWDSANRKVKVIAFIKNIANTVGYDAGAYGTRYAANDDYLGSAHFPYYLTSHSVGSEGIGSTYSVTPPRTYGIEVDYKFY